VTGKLRRDGNYTPEKNNNSIEDSVGNEENGYPVPDLKKTMINILRSPVTTLPPPHPHIKKTLTEEILEEITEKLMEKILDMAQQNVQDPLKIFQNTKNKQHEKTQDK
jgi:hypothetical protein